MSGPTKDSINVKRIVVDGEIISSNPSTVISSIGSLAYSGLRTRDGAGNITPLPSESISAQANLTLLSPPADVGYKTFDFWIIADSTPITFVGEGVGAPISGIDSVLVKAPGDANTFTIAQQTCVVVRMIKVGDNLGPPFNGGLWLACPSGVSATALSSYTPDPFYVHSFTVRNDGNNRWPRGGTVSHASSNIVWQDNGRGNNDFSAFAQTAGVYQFHMHMRSGALPSSNWNWTLVHYRAGGATVHTYESGENERQPNTGTITVDDVLVGDELLARGVFFGNVSATKDTYISITYLGN